MCGLDAVSTHQIDLKTIKANAKQPHRKPTQHIVDAVDKLYETYFPSIYPEPLESLLKLSNSVSKAAIESGEKEPSKELETFISWMLTEKSQVVSSIEQARLWWVLGNIAFDRIAYYRTYSSFGDSATEQEKAILRFKNALQLLETIHINEENLPTSQETLELERYKIQQNILGCYFNADHEKDRENQEEWKHFFHQSDYFIGSDSLITKFPFHWLVARNALRFASLLKNRELVFKYFSNLCDACSLFNNLDYEPYSYPSIAASSQFSFAYELLTNAQSFQ